MIRNTFFSQVLACAVIAAFLVCGAGLSVSRASDAVDTGMSKDIEAGLDLLIKAVRDKSASPDMASFAPVLDFAIASNSPELQKEMPRKREQGNGIFMREEIQVPMEKLVRYCYDPSVPPSVLFPNSIRRGHWLAGSDILNSGVKLWEVLGGLEDPVVLRGVEYEEITPDEFSGSYYGYNLDRLLIVLPYKGHRMFVSVSRQQDTSSVGKKGAIVGNDANWDYVYTDEDGATARGIGWMDTYMYDSSTVTVFFDNGPGSRSTQYAVFKWLKAGWANLNVVKRSHIISGTRRFLDGFRRIIEDSNLPPAEAIVQQMRQFESASEAELVASMQPFCRKVESVASADDILSRKEFQKLIKDAGYAAHLNRDELVHDLMKQFIKSKLGIVSVSG
ncbi:hypothetical protein N1030_05400 [Desulfovibrio mangrovi]|uniref:hypothetical protein n=1 Tax=Desulfovibrio mangrovi TaxID=2976983 RepID=UPI002246FDBB|nr:hypothetical protein [Desulfovibrio mangrovi]UZP68411.1 hypothetical protein N1030_05400 [Desulfovibrio mangrovi]